MRQPNMPYEEIVAAAERLHAEGKLSVRRLKEVVGGGERERLLRATREVREAAHDALSPSNKAPESEVVEISEGLRTCLSRLEGAIISEVRGIRSQELERTRISDAATAASHQEQLRAAESLGDLIQEDLDEAESEVNRLHHAVDQLGIELERERAELERERGARTAVESRRCADAEAHSSERLGLAGALTLAREEASANSESRLRAEATAAAVQATLAATNAELERFRIECLELRGRNEDLIRRLATAETALEHARGALSDAAKANREAERPDGDPHSNTRSAGAPCKKRPKQ